MALIYVLVLLIGITYVATALYKRINRMPEIALPRSRKEPSPLEPGGFGPMSFIISQAVLALIVGSRLLQIQDITVRRELIISVSFGIGAQVLFAASVLLAYRRRLRASQHASENAPK